MNSMEVIFRQMVVSFTLLLLGGLDLRILQHGDSNLWNQISVAQKDTHGRVGVVFFRNFL